MHPKVWTPPDLPEQRSVPDRILQYAARDYVLGQSSQDMLQSIAFRLNSGHNSMEVPLGLDRSDIAFRPNSGHNSMEMGGLDRSELEAEVTEESRQRSAPVELDSHPVCEIGAYKDDRLSQWAKRSPFGAETSGHSSSPVNEAQDLDALPSATRRVERADRSGEGGFF